MKKNISQNYNSLIGKTKKEVLGELGEEFNYYPDKVWSYVLKKYWWGKKWILYIEFDKEDKVIAKFTALRYGKI